MEGEVAIGGALYVLAYPKHARTRARTGTSPLLPREKPPLPLHPTPLPQWRSRAPARPPFSSARPRDRPPATRLYVRRPLPGPIPSPRSPPLRTSHARPKKPPCATCRAWRPSKVDMSSNPTSHSSAIALDVARTIHSSYHSHDRRHSALYVKSQMALCEIQSVIAPLTVERAPRRTRCAPAVPPPSTSRLSRAMLSRRLGFAASDGGAPGSTVL